MKHSFVEDAPRPVVGGRVDPPANWQTMWAWRTLDVIGSVHYWAGAWPIYMRDPLAHEDLRGWLTEKAQETANRYEPRRSEEPERVWAAYLYTSLKAMTRWHWADYTKAPKGSAKRVHLEQYGAAASIEKLTGVEATAEGRAMSEKGMRAPWRNSDASAVPEKYIVMMEDLTTALEALSRRPADYTAPRPVLCTEAGCMGKVDARGLCNRHYKQAQKVGRPDLPRYRKDNSGTCKAEGCESKAKTMELCNAHYIQERDRNGVQCSIEGCERGVRARGWCGQHWQRWRVHGDPLAVVTRAKEKTPCAVAGCERDKHSTIGYCLMHYKRWKKHGDPLLGAKAAA